MSSHFTDLFDVSKEALDAYGAFDISLISDLPLFIDPFLLFTSEKEEYQALHQRIIKYLEFLRDKSIGGEVTNAGLERWFTFHEVKQNWLGFTVLGNGGSALGREFAVSLNSSLGQIFKKFGNETISKSSHLEKLCLIREGVGRDNISDFTVNLIKQYLLEYTQKFAVEHINPVLRKKVTVEKVFFHKDTETWIPKEYDLPYFNGDFVLLTPKDMLTRDDTWINRKDMINDFYLIPTAISDAALRESVEDYFRRKLPVDPTKEAERFAAMLTIENFPQLIDYYIKIKEDRGDRAVSVSEDKVEDSEKWFVENARIAINKLANEHFYEKYDYNSYDEAIKRAEFFKDCIENRDVWRAFYDDDNRPIANEKHAQHLFVLVWFASIFSFDREVNNGRGPVDFKVSFGSFNSALVEFKLAKNNKLRQGFETQVPIYEAANKTDQTVKVIVCFSEKEQTKVSSLLKKLNLTGRRDIIIVDARNDNKPSASNAR